MHRVSKCFCCASAVALIAVVVPASVTAQFITRWVNANGVITFSTSSPPPGVQYEAVPMPEGGGRGSADGTALAPEAEKAGKTREDKAPTDAAKDSGPAKLSVSDQTTTSLGETQWVLAGKVKNEGGAPADGVGVHISVLEDGQGNPCLDQKGGVSPSTLQPGETGTFELTFNSPCFFGSPQIDIVAEWQK